MLRPMILAGVAGCSRGGTDGWDIGVAESGRAFELRRHALDSSGIGRDSPLPNPPWKSITKMGAHNIASIIRAQTHLVKVDRT